MRKDKFNKFSVSLGLFDYINPVFYSVTIITIVKNISFELGNPYNLFLIMGAILSILFGFVIPTGKVIVGLSIIKFKMPVSLVFCVNAGILLSGLMILKYVMNLKLVLLLIISLIILKNVRLDITIKKTLTIKLVF